MRKVITAREAEELLRKGETAPADAILTPSARDLLQGRVKLTGQPSRRPRPGRPRSRSCGGSGPGAEGNEATVRHSGLRVQVDARKRSEDAGRDRAVLQIAGDRDAQEADLRHWAAHLGEELRRRQRRQHDGPGGRQSGSVHPDPDFEGIHDAGRYLPDRSRRQTAGGHAQAHQRGHDAPGDHEEAAPRQGLRPRHPRTPPPLPWPASFRPPA